MGNVRSFRDIIGIAAPSITLLASLAVVVGTVSGADVPQIQLEVAAVVATLSAWSLVTELFP